MAEDEKFEIAIGGCAAAQDEEAISMRRRA